MKNAGGLFWERHFAARKKTSDINQSGLGAQKTPLTMEMGYAFMEMTHHRYDSPKYEAGLDENYQELHKKISQLREAIKAPNEKES